MGDQKTDIAVRITCDCHDLGVDFDKLGRLAQSVCRSFALKKAIVNIVIVDDEAIKKVNTDFLSTPQPTDVISFDLSDDASVKNYDLMVNAAEAARQARRRGHSTEAELALYITHGLLHNLGFDDADEARSRIMHDMEDKILQQAGFGVIYGK
jgi:probable rRNA maturation factor